MAHRQTYLAAPDPIPTLEEAYWKVMTTLTEVEDFVIQCKAVDHVTHELRREAGVLHRTLTNETFYMDALWRSEGNVAKFNNAKTWIEMIAQETILTLASVDTVMAIPGSLPRRRQTETHKNLHATQVDTVTPDVVRRTTISTTQAPHDKLRGHFPMPASPSRPHPTSYMRKQSQSTSPATSAKVDTRPRQEARGTFRDSRSLPRLMDIHIPLVSTYPPVPTRQDQPHRRAPKLGKRKPPQSSENQPPAKKLAGTPGNTLTQTRQLELVTVKQEPASTGSVARKGKSHKDALALPDIKPDIAALHDDSENFMTRVTKGSRRIMIEDHSTPCVGDKEPRPNARAARALSMSQATTTQTSTRHDNRAGQHQDS